MWWHIVHQCDDTGDVMIPEMMWVLLCFIEIMSACIRDAKDSIWASNRIITKCHPLCQLTPDKDAWAFYLSQMLFNQCCTSTSVLFGMVCTTWLPGAPAPGNPFMPSALVWGFEWGIYSHNVRMYVSVTLRNVNLRMSQNSYVMCTDTGEYRMSSLAANDGGQGRTALLDNEGRVGQRDWSSATYAFCRVEYRTQPMVCGIEKEKSRYSRS